MTVLIRSVDISSMYEISTDLIKTVIYSRYDAAIKNKVVLCS